MTSISRKRSSQPSLTILNLILITIISSRTYGYMYDDANIDRGSRLMSGCSSCCGECKLQFFNSGSMSRNQAWASRTTATCTSDCNKLRYECRRVCIQSVAVGTVDTNTGCGCKASSKDIKSLKAGCFDACDGSKADCVVGCTVKGRCETDATLNIEWESDVNGTCGSVCDSGPSDDCKWFFLNSS